MINSDLKQYPSATLSASSRLFATAKWSVSDQLKKLGIEDISDLATRIGYLIVGAYGVAMVINLTSLYT